MCVTWTQNDVIQGGAASIYLDGSNIANQQAFATGVIFQGGGAIWVGNAEGLNNQFEGQITSMNMWDKVITTASIQSLASGYQTEAGNVLHWSFFAAMAHGNVQLSAYSSVSPKGTEYEFKCPFKGNLSINPSVHTSCHPSIHPSIHLSTHFSIHLSIHLSIFLSTHPTTHSSFLTSIHPSFLSSFLSSRCFLHYTQKTTAHYPSCVQTVSLSLSQYHYLN